MGPPTRNDPKFRREEKRCPPPEYGRNSGELGDGLGNGPVARITKKVVRPFNYLAAFTANTFLAPHIRLHAVLFTYRLDRFSSTHGVISFP